MGGDPVLILVFSIKLIVIAVVVATTDYISDVRQCDTERVKEIVRVIGRRRTNEIQTMCSKYSYI
jgi:hypothetical protein